MKNTLFFKGIPTACVMVVLLSVGACQKSAQQAGNCPLPSGRFINMTLLNQCPGKMPADQPFFCVEINFKDSSSVEVDNGFELFPLGIAAAESGCRHSFKKATQFGDMPFTVLNDSTFILEDTAWTRLDTGSVFKRVTHADGQHRKFKEALSDCLLTGEYSLFKNGEIVPHTVTLMENGQVNGLKPYIAYELCYAGDCLETTSPPSRIITFIDMDGKRDDYSFKNIEGKMAIEIYSIGPPIPDVKGERAIGPMVYEFRTE